MDVLSTKHNSLGNLLVDFELIKELQSAAKGNLKKRCRINLHKDLNSELHEMLIYMDSESIVPVHMHTDRDETYVVIEGRAKINIYSDSKELISSINLGPYSEGETFIFKTIKRQWHNLEVLSDYVLLLEITTGPFNPENTKFS